MHSTYEQLLHNLNSVPKSWLVTGCAGFIGSNILEQLLMLGQTVTGLDNFSTGSRANLDEVRSLVGEDLWARFTFIEGDIRDPKVCASACQGVEYVLHQAALGSVPRSIDDPATSHDVNVTGTLTLMLAACQAGVKRFVYASSSAVYGDHPALPKKEELIGLPLSPYAVTKYVNELYAAQMVRHYDMECVGLRYFNVFGQRQNPNGPYAAVIPLWIASMIGAKPIHINGNGETSRDFCYVANVVQANLLAATCENQAAIDQVFNVALNDRTTLNQLFEMLRSRLTSWFPHLMQTSPIYRDFRAGDVMHSQADIGKAQQLLGYQPSHTIEQGIYEALDWYLNNAEILEAARS